MTEIEASCIQESLRDLEITKIECDREIKKIITDETELERNLDESLKFSFKIKRKKKKIGECATATKQNKRERSNFN